MNLHSDPHRDSNAEDPPFTQAARADILLDGGQGGEQTLREAVLILRKHALFIALCACAVLAAGVAYCYFTVPQYTATATVLVDKEAGLDLGVLASAIGAGGTTPRLLWKRKST